MTGEATFTYIPLASDHDLIYADAYARLLTGHGTEYRLAWPLSDWHAGAKAELERRGLLKDAKRTRRLLLKEHHAHDKPPTTATRHTQTDAREDRP
jgi:hypothetical protein